MRCESRPLVTDPAPPSSHPDGPMTERLLGDTLPLMGLRRGTLSTRRRASAAARGALIAVVVGGLVGCSSQAPEDENVSDDPFTLGPFQSYLFAELGADEDAMSQAEHLLRESKIAECVTAAGFEYTIAPEPNIVSVGGSVADWEANLRTKGWGQFTHALDDDPRPDVQHEPTEQDEYVESLSIEARTAYERVLFGEHDPSTGEPVPGQEGCMYLAHVGDDPSDPANAYADLLEEVRNAWEVAEADPEFAEVRTAYRECMSRAGFPGIRVDPNELLEQRFLEEFPDMTIRSNDPRLPELATWEISMANAHVDCTDETDLYAAQNRAIAKVENEIMERRAAEVEAYIAMLREQTTGS